LIDVNYRDIKKRKRKTTIAHQT